MVIWFQLSAAPLAHIPSCFCLICLSDLSKPTSNSLSRSSLSLLCFWLTSCHSACHEHPRQTKTSDDARNRLQLMPSDGLSRINCNYQSAHRFTAVRTGRPQQRWNKDLRSLSRSLSDDSWREAAGTWGGRNRPWATCQTAGNTRSA